MKSNYFDNSFILFVLYYCISTYSKLKFYSNNILFVIKWCCYFDNGFQCDAVMSMCKSLDDLGSYWLCANYTGPGFYQLILILDSEKYIKDWRIEIKHGGIWRYYLFLKIYVMSHMFKSINILS